MRSLIEWMRFQGGYHADQFHQLELDLASGNAAVLLESLGLAPDSIGEIPIDAVRVRLANPAVRRRAEEEGITPYLDRLDQLIGLADADDTSRLEWA